MREGQDAALLGEDGRTLLAVLRLREKFGYDRAREAREVYRTEDETHPGVAAVLTHEDVPGEKTHGLVHFDWPILCWDKVRYMGDAVAIVAAETPELAAEALALIEVDYEPLPVVADAEYALSPDAPVLHEQWETGNLLKHIKVRHGDIDAGFAEADVFVSEPHLALKIPASDNIMVGDVELTSDFKISQPP